MMETKQEKYELVITADNVTSTDCRFTMENIGIGDNYKPLDSYYKKSGGEIIRRKCHKGERKSSNQTMPRLACQVFEQNIARLSLEEKETFPVCQYTTNTDVISGIFSSIENFRKYKNTIEYLTYDYDEGRQFVIYCWNIFSTILFIKECLKRFGGVGDEFVLIYREKDKKEEV